jgi:hypothetical protein
MFVGLGVRRCEVVMGQCVGVDRRCGIRMGSVIGVCGGGGVGLVSVVVSLFVTIAVVLVTVSSWF